MKRFSSLVVVAAFSFVACSECSDRQQHDITTEKELDDALGRDFAPSFDAGVAELARLETALAPALEVTTQRLAELANVSIDDVHTDNGTSVTVRDRATARALINGLRARRIQVLWMKELDDGALNVGVDLLDREYLFAPDVFPTWLPESADGYPCWSECKERIRRIVEKRELLTQFTTSLDRLRQLRRVERWLATETHPVTPEAWNLLNRVVDARFPPGTMFHAHSEVTTVTQVTVCRSGLSIAECEQRFDAGCVIADVCPVGQRCVNAEDCGVVITP